MVRHIIVLGSSFKKGKRIALDYIENEDNLNRILRLLKVLNERVEDSNIAFHSFSSESMKWEDLAKQDKFFEGVSLVKNERDFIRLIQDDKKLSSLDVADYILTKFKCTHTRLEKLTYFCYADYLCRYNQKLFDDKIYAFKYGPVVLAAELGIDSKMTLRQVGVQCDVSANKLVCGDIYELTGNYGGTSNLPLLSGETVLVKNSTVQDFLQDINSHFEKISRPDGILAFRLKDTSWQGDFIFSPYYLINNQRYGIYWIFANKLEQTLEHNAFSTNSKGERTMFIEGIGIGYGAQTEGNATTWPFMQEKGTGSVGDPNELTRYAKAGGSFSYMFKVRPDKQNYLVCTFLKEDKGKTICIKSGFKKIAAVTLDYKGSDEKYTMEFKIPRSLTKKSEIRIGFMGIKKAESARLCSPVNTVYN